MSLRIAIGWPGIPYYAARCIREAIEHVGAEVELVATHAEPPMGDIERVAGRVIHWVESDAKMDWKRLGLRAPDIFFVGGWAVVALHRLAVETKTAGGRVVCMMDNIPRAGLRQIGGAIYYRLYLRRIYDAAFVPGTESVRLARRFGVRSGRIFTGLYGADRTVFSPPDRSHKRTSEFLYVGQFIRRKGIDLLLSAFRDVRAEHPEWTLRLIGAGPLEETIVGDGVVREGFLRPEDLAARYKNARYLVLPSRDEHWGVVVHEAALSGCPLILSDRVGAGADLLTDLNGFRFRAGSVQSLREAMERAATISGREFADMSLESLQLGTKFGPKRWAESFSDVVARLTEKTSTEGPNVQRSR